MLRSNRRSSATTAATAVPEPDRRPAQSSEGRPDKRLSLSALFRRRSSGERHGKLGKRNSGCGGTARVNDPDPESGARPSVASTRDTPSDLLPGHAAPPATSSCAAPPEPPPPPGVCGTVRRRPPSLVVKGVRKVNAWDHSDTESHARMSTRLRPGTSREDGRGVR